MSRDCETHLYFLWEARRLYPEQPDRFKQIASELRVLVCRTATNHPLLLDLMDELNFSHEVPPPGPPFDKQPTPIVGWRDEPIQQELTAEAQASLGDEGRIAAVLEKQAGLRRAIPLREDVDKARLSSSPRTTTATGS